MNKKKTAGIAGLLAAAGISAAVSFGGTAEIPYKIEAKNEYAAEMQLDVPERLQADIAELYLHGKAVDRVLLPEAFTSLPIVFSDLENLEVKLYKAGTEIGTANFEDGKLNLKKI